MKTKIIFATRCNPTRTTAKLQKLSGSGTAYVTELVSNKRGENFISNDNFLFQREWEKLDSFDDLAKAAKSGRDVVYKTASLSGRSRFYARKVS